MTSNLNYDSDDSYATCEDSYDTCEESGGEGVQSASDQQRLGEWLSHAEKQILQFNDLPIHPKEFKEQSKEIADFVNEISMQAPLLENVIENTRELFAHIGRSEAIALQMHTDQLKQRYNNLADDANSKVAIWEKALNLLDGQTELKKYLEDVEEYLQSLSQVSLEEQFQLISTTESDLGLAREQLESIQLISRELQRLTTENRANQFAKESAELLSYFKSVADTVTKKAELLRKLNPVQSSVSNSQNSFIVEQRLNIPQQFRNFGNSFRHDQFGNFGNDYKRGNFDDMCSESVINDIASDIASAAVKEELLNRGDTKQAKQKEGNELTECQKNTQKPHSGSFNDNYKCTFINGNNCKFYIPTGKSHKQIRASSSLKDLNSFSSSNSSDDSNKENNKLKLQLKIEKRNREKKEKELNAEIAELKTAVKELLAKQNNNAQSSSQKIPLHDATICCKPSILKKFRTSKNCKKVTFAI
ncbi:hypothetical protein ACQ4LE_000408 [Meloidogyne hapla]